jgi:hypothetical protein
VRCCRQLGQYKVAVFSTIVSSATAGLILDGLTEVRAKPGLERVRNALQGPAYKHHKYDKPWEFFKDRTVLFGEYEHNFHGLYEGEEARRGVESPPRS